MATQRHSVGIEESCRALLVPYQVVSPHVWVGHHQPSREHSLTEQDNRPVPLHDSPVLLPQFVKRKNPVPLGVCVPLVQHLIRRVAYDGINRPVGDVVHPLKAVHVIYAIEFNHGCDDC